MHITPLSRENRPPFSLLYCASRPFRSFATGSGYNAESPDPIVKHMTAKCYLLLRDPQACIIGRKYPNIRNHIN